MRNLPKDSEVLPSPLLLEQMEREAVQLHSPPASLVVHQGPAAKPTSSFRRKKRRRGAPSCVSAAEEYPMAAAVMSGAVVSLPAGGRVSASNSASSFATAQSPRLGAAPPMPSSLAPAQCSESTPEELEERLRPGLQGAAALQSSPRQVSRELLLLLQSSPRQDSRELLLLQRSPRQDSRKLLQSSPRQDSREMLQSSPRQVYSLL
ncbi:hypothetical protein CRENBAI_007088 [Crenichthys baileyi]|uniref:Uncharacterized protein n=1 Tax=Crenichthys baileyi TaxID=28760 RepID=A0AAV9QQ79_9TELE